MEVQEVISIVKSDVRSEVKWFNSSKGFGFLVGEEPDFVDIFVHFSFIEMEGYKTLNKGDYVKYDLVETNRGLQARSVRPESVAQKV